MIDFPCKCGYCFSLPEDLAGGLVQCPRCKLLVDVPTISQYRELEPDGTIKLDEPPPLHEPGRIHDLERAFNPSHVDDYGVEYDLRSTPEEVARAGDIPEDEFEPDHPAAPKYDPETGELIRPLDLAPPKAVPVIPIPPAQKVEGGTLEYARVARNDLHVARQYPLPLAIFMGGNSVVMLAVFLAHALTNLLTLAVLVRLWFVVVAPVVIFMAVLAHYANIVEDTGVFERDELPTPLRHAQWGEDIWGPFCSIFFALMLCYAPAVAVGIYLSPGLAAVAGIVGSIFFPAVFLTTVTSGTVLNLRPDRVMGVIGQSGWRYFVSVALWAATLITYGPALLRSSFLVKQIGPAALPWNNFAGSYAMLFAGIMVAHLFCWHLGLIYRGRHERFPWILQRHTPREQKKIERRRPRYVHKNGQPAATDPPRRAPRQGAG